MSGDSPADGPVLGTFDPRTDAGQTNPHGTDIATPAQDPGTRPPTTGPQAAATRTIEMIRTQFPDQLGDVAREAGLIVWHLGRVPGAIRYSDDDLDLIQRQVAADLVWGGQRAAVNSARGFFGLSAEAVPPFDPAVREIFGESLFNVERAEISLTLTAGRDEYMADAARILEEMAFEGAQAERESREVLLVAAEIARGQRSTGTGHESGARLAHRLIGQVRPNTSDFPVHGSAGAQPGPSAQAGAATRDGEASFEDALTSEVNDRLRGTRAVSRDQVLRVWELLKDERSEAALPVTVSGRADVVAQVIQLGEERSEEAFRGPGGAVGFEGETAIEVTKPDGTPLKPGTVLAVHTDGHKLVIDERYFVVDTEGRYHADERDLEAAGKEFERKEESSVAEAVSSPYGIHGDPDRRTSDRPETVSNIDNALYKLYQGNGLTIGEVLDGEDGWHVNEEETADLINVLPLDVGYDIARGGVPVFPQESVGVALAGMYGFLTYLGEQFPPASPGMAWQAQVHLEAALAFGTDIAADFVAAQYETSISPHEVDLLTDVESVMAIRGFMALVYTQVAAIIHHHPSGDDEFVKNFTAVVSRTSLGGIRAIAPRDVRSYLEANAQTVRDRLVARYQKTMRTTYGIKAGPDVLQTPVAHGTVGDYLDNALLKQPGKRFNQTEGIDVHTAFDMADDNDGRLDPALIVLEARGAGAQLIGIRDIGEKLDLIETRARSEYEYARRIRGRQVGPSELATLLGTDQAKKVRKIWERTRKLTEGDSGNGELLSAAAVKNILKGLRAVGTGRSLSAVPSAGRTLAELVRRLEAVEVIGHSERATTRLKASIQSSLADIRNLESHLGVNVGSSGAHDHGPIMEDDTSPLAPVATEEPVPGGDVLRLRGGAGTDIVDDWETESALSWRHPRSKDLARIDETLATWRDRGRHAAIPPQEKEAQLDRILSAIDEWWEKKEGRPTKRYSAVLRLQERIRDERAAARAQSAAPPAMPMPSEPVHEPRPGWADLYARRLHDALSGDPVNSAAVIAVLRLVGRDADRVRELEDAFAALDTEDGPTTIASEMGQAVEDGRLSDEGYESYLRLLGYVDVFTVEPVTDFRTAIPLEAAAPGSVVSEEEFPEVWDYARGVAQAVEGGRDDVAVELLRRLDRNERSLWLLAKVYRALTGRHLLEDLDAAADPDLDPGLAPLAHSVHPDDAADYYRWLAESSFDHLSDGHLPIPAGHPEDGCILRAHLWVLQLRQWGVDARKVLALPAEGQSLVTHSANAFGATSDTPRPVYWERHIAPLIRVDPGNGDPAEDMVLDPALGLGTAVPVWQWLEAIGVQGDYTLVDADSVSGDDLVDRSSPRVVFGPAHANFVQGTGFSTEFPLDLMDAVLRDQEDRLRDQSLEAQRRQEFRDWHAGLDPRARGEFNGYYGSLSDSDVHGFQEWFRSRRPDDLRRYAAELGERARARAEQGPAQGASGTPLSPLTTERPDGHRPVNSAQGSAKDALTRLLAEAPAEYRAHTWFDPASTRPVSSAFDVRRVEQGGERVTEVTITVDLRAQAGLTPHDVADTWQRVNAGVDEFFNRPRHRFTHGDLAGDVLRVRVVPVRPGGRPHLTVRLLPYAPDRLMSQHTWVVGQRPVFYTHEIAHQLGGRDESRRPSRDYRLGDTTYTITRTAQNAGSLLGNFDAAAEDGLPQAGLRSRHLDLLSTLIGHIPAYTRRDRVQAVLAAAQSLTGSLSWRGGTELDYERWVIAEDTGWGAPDDFARWIHGTGDEPTEQSTMNCWEAVLFAAYRAGVVGKPWIEMIHKAAGDAAANADTTVDPHSIYPYAGYSANEAAFHASLMLSMISGDLQRYEYGTGATDIPAGHLVFFGGIGGHVALSLGTRDAQNRQQVISLWNQPNGIATGLNLGYLASFTTANKYGFMQVTSVEELIDEGFSVTGTVVEFAAPRWEQSALTGIPGTRAGSGAPNTTTASTSRSTRPDAATAGTRPADAGRSRSAVADRSRRLPPTAPPPTGALPPLPPAPGTSQDDVSPLAPAAAEAPTSYTDQPPEYVEGAPEYTPESIPEYADTPASPRTVAAGAAQLELDEEQTAALLRYSWFDAGRFAAVRTQVGEFEPADLAAWIDRIGRIPEDLSTIAEHLAPMHVHDVYEVSRELGIDPRHLRLFTQDLNEVYARSAEPGFDALAGIRDLFEIRYVPADQFADFVTAAVRAGVTPDEMRRVLRAQENEHLTPGRLVRMDLEALLDRVDSALRFHPGGSSRLTVEEAANRILHHQMPGDLTESQSGKVADRWFADTTAQLEAILNRTSAGADDRVRWATNRARRLVDLRRNGVDVGTAGEAPVAGSSTGPGTLAGERLAPTQEEIQAAADRLPAMTSADVTWLMDTFRVDPRDLWIFGDRLPRLFAATDDDPYLEVVQLLDAYSTDHAAFASVAGRIGLDADDMRVLLESVWHSEGVTLSDLRRMPAAQLTHLAQSELAPWRELAAQLAPMTVADIANVSHEHGIDPGNLWIFGSALPTIFSPASDENHNVFDAVHRLFDRYSEDISTFANVVVRAGTSVEDLATVLPYFEVRQNLTLDDLRTAEPDALRAAIRDTLSHLRGIAPGFSMSVADLSRVIREHRIDPDHLGIFGNALSAIFSQSGEENRDPFDDLRELFAGYSEDISAFASVAVRAGVHAEDLAAVLIVFASRRHLGLEDLGRMRRAELQAVVDRELSFLSDAADQIPPMNPREVAYVSGQLRLEPALLRVFRDELQAAFTPPRSEASVAAGFAAIDGIVDVIRAFAASIPVFNGSRTNFVSIAFEANMTAGELITVLSSFSSRSARRLPPTLDDFVAAVRDRLGQLQEAAEQLAPMSVSDVSRVSREFRLEPRHLWIFGWALSGIYSRAQAGGADPLPEVREMLTQFAEPGEIHAFTTMASRAGISAESMRTVVDHARRSGRSLADLQELDPGQIFDLAHAAPPTEEPGSSAQAAPGILGDRPVPEPIVSIGYQDLFEEALAGLAGLPEAQLNDLMVRAGQINGVYHQPLPMVMDQVSDEQRAVYESVTLMVAAQLHANRDEEDPEDDARFLSERLARKLGTQRRTGGAPVGSSRPPVDPYEIGGRGESSGTTAGTTATGAAEEQRAEVPARHDPDVPASAAPRVFFDEPRSAPEETARENGALRTRAARSAHIDVDADGISYASSSYSAFDGDGQPIRDDARACVEVAVILR